MVEQKKLWYVLVAVIFFGATASRGVAEAVTLEFEAEVEQINRDPTPLSLPFDVNVGDIIRGTFTFDPLNVDSTVGRTETTQPYYATFEIGGYSFSSANYLAQSFNDELSDEDDGGVFGPPSGPQDIIRLNQELSGDLDDPLMLQVGFFFAFFGDEHVLDGADLGNWDRL